MNKATTKGGLVLEEINIGDWLCETEYGHTIISIVETKPERTVTEDGDAKWRWTSSIVGAEATVDYLITENYEHYGPNLYRYEEHIHGNQLRGV